MSTFQTIQTVLNFSIALSVSFWFVMALAVPAYQAMWDAAGEQPVLPETGISEDSDPELAAFSMRAIHTQEALIEQLEAIAAQPVSTQEPVLPTFTIDTDSEPVWSSEPELDYWKDAQYMTQTIRELKAFASSIQKSNPSPALKGFSKMTKAQLATALVKAGY